MAFYLVSKHDFFFFSNENLGHGAYATLKPFISILHGYIYIYKYIFGFQPKRPYMTFYLVFKHDLFFSSNEHLGHGAHATLTTLTLVSHGYINTFLWISAKTTVHCFLFHFQTRIFFLFQMKISVTAPMQH